MSYYAVGVGNIIAKDVESFLTLEKMFGGDLSEFGDGFYMPYEYSGYEEDLSFALSVDEKYYEYEINDFLGEIVNYIREGEIEYRGEDGCIWHFLYDPSTSSWKEENGYVAYGETSLSGYSDDELIVELQKRGHSIQKVSL